ncbi:MAG: Glutathione S-transferase [Ramlibacter sp.]|nr:Glutathione S-transferase [Ramlibacter sp.]
MLELYHSPISTCSQKVRLILAEKKIEWKSHAVKLATGEHLTEAYRKLNPNGVVPTLVHDGDPIVDSSVINEYLDDVFPDHPVRPGEPKALARMRAWRQYIDEVATPAIRVPSFNAFFVPIWQSMSDDEFFAYTEKLPLRKHFYRKMGRDGFGEADMDEALDKLGQTLDRMEDALAEGPWLMGQRYTIADASITPTIVRMEDAGLAGMWTNHPGVAAWYLRIQDRPNFSVAYMPGSRDISPSC